ncbi:hypothetical protein [Marinicellulosiphila megalodicopiae]|uniref:hypothetical protein n=1 Tax=Marinicellulosiphila megalodicopiae TaxID=2724896 RepID=UPI003BAE6A5D
MTIKPLLFLIPSLTFLACNDSFLDENAQLLKSDSQLINEDHYWVQVFDAKKTGDFKIKAELKSGPSVEIYFLDNSNYNLWETQVANGQYSSATFKYYKDLSIIPLASSDESEWTKIEEGRYAIIVENTDYGTVAPPFNLVDDSALVELEIWGY